MALIAVNATAAGWTGMAALETALARLPAGGAVTLMIHGYRFCPDRPAHDPHRHVLGLRPDAAHPTALSWPRHLHLDRRDDRLGIALGWPARGPLPRVAARARATGSALGDLLAAIHARRPDLPLALFAHSLGVRVALAAVAAAPRGAVRRAILLAGAEDTAAARAALATPGGAALSVLNVTSAENALFDRAFRLAVPPSVPGAPALAAGLAGAPGWCDLAIDRAATRAALARLGHRVAPPARRVCHWSGYLRAGLFPLYRRVLEPGGPDILPALAQALARAEVAAAAGGAPGPHSPCAHALRSAARVPI